MPTKSFSWRMLTWPPSLALLLSALLFVPGSLHRWLHRIYLKDARPSPRPTLHCQRLVSMSLTSCRLEKKQLFHKCCLLGSSLQDLYCSCCAVPTAVGDTAPPKATVHEESSTGMQPTLANFFIFLEPDQWRRNFWVWEQRRRITTVSFLALIPEHCPPQTVWGWAHK